YYSKEYDEEREMEPRPVQMGAGLKGNPTTGGLQTKNRGWWKSCRKPSSATRNPPREK
ncbi:hypothetical protein Tco_0498621, partial [Tanacetum coccineum]